jgi:biotin synthase
VIWPKYPLDEILARLDVAAREGRLRRCCLQATAARGYYERALRVVRKVCEAISLPTNIAILIRDVEQAAALYGAGIDRIGFGLDAACERVYRQTKGSGWSRTLATIEAVARQYPGRASVHLIVGLGETEREMVGRVLWAEALGVGVGLFAFTPVRGTAFAARLAPPLAVYRRMQAARWLIVHHGARSNAFHFDEQGALVDICVPGVPDLVRLLSTGAAFRTSGCPDCNRPFYNERPGGPMYNYARPLTPDETCQAIDDMALEYTEH